jgi:hypothetical protein
MLLLQCVLQVFAAPRCPKSPTADWGTHAGAGFDSKLKDHESTASWTVYIRRSDEVTFVNLDSSQYSVLNTL